MTNEMKKAKKEWIKSNSGTYNPNKIENYGTVHENSTEKKDISVIELWKHDENDDTPTTYSVSWKRGVKDKQNNSQNNVRFIGRGGDMEFESYEEAKEKIEELKNEHPEGFSKDYLKKRERESVKRTMSMEEYLKKHKNTGEVS